MEDACQSGNLAEVERLLALGFDPSMNCNFPIELASSMGYLAIVNRLLEDSRDPTRFTEEEITNFVRRDDYFAVKKAITRRLPVYNDMRKYILDEDTFAIAEFIHSRK
jgi:hypothetical protein